MRLLAWIYEVAFGCHHGQLSRVFTIKKRTYQVCFECGKEFEYSLVQMRSLPSKVANDDFALNKPQHAHLPLS